jgi:ABC-type nitrate/sulfonate/bicarbonate transport system substrate-binding protein
VPLYYGQEKGFFAQERLDLQVLVVRGIVGVSSLMSGEIDVTCHAGSGFSAALRGVPVKIISVTRDRPIHELIVAPAANSSAELKGKSIAVGSLDGTAAVMTRRILQAKGLDAQKDVGLLSMDTPARLQSLFSGRVAGAMMTPRRRFIWRKRRATKCSAAVVTICAICRPAWFQRIYRSSRSARSWCDS